MVRWYKNSFLASIVSICGCLLIMGGILTFSDEVGLAIGCIAAGLALVVCGHFISKAKAFRTWWNKVATAELVVQITSSNAAAIAVYQKNPCRQMLKEIEKLNPQAAEQIRASKAK